jgi:hypothetical protein
MKHLLMFFLFCVAVISPIEDACAVEIEPTVYLSDGPNHCITIEGSEFWIFIHSPDDGDFTGISLDLDLSGLSITPPVVYPGTDVILHSFDVSSMPYHFLATWTSRPLEHEPIIRLSFDTDPGLTGFQTPLNVVLIRGIGGTEEGIGLSSFAGCCVDCFPCHHGLYIDDHFLVEIGASTMIPFEWDWNCFNYGGGDITVTDTGGWVVSWTPTYAFDWTMCGPCFMPRFAGSIDVMVPDDIAVGTTSTLTLEGLNNSIIITLEAEDAVATEKTTWGRIKAIYDR